MQTEHDWLDIVKLLWIPALIFFILSFSRGESADSARYSAWRPE